MALTGWADKLITWQCFLSIIVLLACTVLQRWLFLSAVVEKKAVRSFVSPSKRVKRKHDSGPRLKDPPPLPIAWAACGPVYSLVSRVKIFEILHGYLRLANVSTNLTFYCFLCAQSPATISEIETILAFISKSHLKFLQTETQNLDTPPIRFIP